MVPRLPQVLVNLCYGSASGDRGSMHAPATGTGYVCLVGGTLEESDEDIIWANVARGKIASPGRPDPSLRTQPWIACHEDSGRRPPHFNHRQDGAIILIWSASLGYMTSKYHDQL